MGNNKFAVVYFLIFASILGLLSMVLGYTDFSFMKVLLFIGGITLLIIAVRKKESKPNYL